jgi:hypothetical protein
MKEGFMELAAKVKSYIVGVPQPAKGVDRIPQLESALAESDVVIADAQEAKELALLAVEDGERGARERLAATQGELEAAKRAKDEILDALRVARRLADRRATEVARKARTASWKEAERLAQERVVAAGKLADALRAAGECYAELVRLGIATFDAMPVRSGGHSAYRLSRVDVAAIAGIDMLRAGLPDPARISPSMLDQYPGITEVAASGLDLVQLARREDEAKP